MSERLHIVFKGEILPDANLEQAQAALGKLLKIGPPQLLSLFSGKSVVVKKNADPQTAKKYKAAFAQAGVVCHLVPAQASSTTTAPQPKVAETSAVSTAEAPAPAVQVQADINMDAVTLAPVGADVIENPQKPEPMQIEEIHADLAPVGSDLGQIKNTEQAPLPNTDGLTLE